MNRLLAVLFVWVLAQFIVYAGQRFALAVASHSMSSWEADIDRLAEEARQ